MRRMQAPAVAVVLVGLCLLTGGSVVRAQSSGPLFIGLGDSLGEGVQSGDANALTQPYSFIDILSLLMNAPMPLPYIQSNALGTVESLDGRSRIDASTEGLDLAVSGADTSTLLTTRADAATVADITTETDLVLFPRTGSQIEIAEALHPQLVACWIGSNDALPAVTAYDHLDGSQLTPLSDFTANFNEIAARLAATGAKVVFGTIPHVTRIAYLIDAQDLQRLTGSGAGLPPGSYTTLVTTMAIKLGLVDRSILANPDFVLDPSEITAIDQRIDQFNDVIRSTAAAYGMGVADVAGVFDQFATQPPVLFGIPLTTRFLGGLFSLDGIHPSDIGQLIVARLFVEAFDRQYGLNIPDVSDQMAAWFFFTDPFIDKDGDGRVTGRFGAGLLETLGPLLGWSGDTNDVLPSTGTATNSSAAIDRLQQATGVDLRHATRKQRLEVLARALGITHGKP